MRVTSAVTSAMTSLKAFTPTADRKWARIIGEMRPPESDSRVVRRVRLPRWRRCAGRRRSRGGIRSLCEDVAWRTL